MGVDSTKPSTPPARESSSARGSLIYAVGFALALLGVLAVALYRISSDRTASRPGAALEGAVPAALPAALERELAKSAELRARLGSLGEQLDALAQHAASLRKRVETLEHALARRAAVATTPAAPPAPSSGSSVPEDLAPLFERLSVVETSLQREGEARLESQEDLLARVHTLESSREDGAAARHAVQGAAEERVFNLEQRVHAAETQLVELEKRRSAR